MSYWIIVVDDDTANLHMAGHILSRNNMRVTALKSGRALIDYTKEKGQPDLILLDINMPVMDGFETLKELRSLEASLGREETPVIFLTADDDSETETQGFEAGVSDYIKKPFNPEILLRRISNVITKQDRIKSLRTEAATDKLTGFLNKAGASSELGRLCRSSEGVLMMIDLDSFKLVNDLYGHEMGDKVLIDFAKIVSEAVPEGSTCGRIGGDEFVAFCPGVTEESTVAKLAELINVRMTEDAVKLMGEDMNIPLGASVGAVFVPEYGRDYDSLMKLADSALYHVKQNGKHGSSVYSPASQAADGSEINSVEADLITLSAVIGERNIPNSALWLDKEIFSGVYRYIMRYIVRNQRRACKVLFTLSGGDMSPEKFESLCAEFGEHIKNHLRKSDILMRNKYNQYFVLLADIHEAAVKIVIGNILRSWKEQTDGGLTVEYITEYVGGAENLGGQGKKLCAAVADGDPASLAAVSEIIRSGGYETEKFLSGEELVSFIRGRLPQLIIISSTLSDMKGSDALRRIKSMGGDAADTPVIFACDSDAEIPEVISIGASDVVSRPAGRDILLLRARSAVELVTLKRSMSIEVEMRIRESRDLFMSIVRSFADIIDSKDHPAAGHSRRVAEYSKEIARRAGMSEKQQNDIYVAALLHDVGKLDVPDQVLCKPGRLTEEEFELVKRHSARGAGALEDLPELAAGARWHHEFYGGGGYPDGLKGEEIPDGARIIAVADAYAAMTSRRVYRPSMPQDKVRAEIENGRGTQFDPVYADIMLAMIDADTDYRMREE